ncbi:hypothetical protein BDV27DRAFT_120386 [Aspergillus caelatus]|uniref:Uncharacterized protein n=1 Tax=Aspergillus caelatus TaxID=61420 RepID=A0A5N7ALX5_9EURO|nr:uncharacterized protein BDV27DRAFT_120386 [Aspergillus caelatus]KAE8369700.1 hypothetical protein BDV27DRAFT_120386 [Aspergillus caelatus]
MVKEPREWSKSMKTTLTQKLYGKETNTAIYILSPPGALKTYTIGVGSVLPQDSFTSGVLKKHSYLTKLTNRIAKDSNALHRCRDPQI